MDSQTPTATQPSPASPGPQDANHRNSQNLGQQQQQQQQQHQHQRPLSQYAPPPQEQQHFATQPANPAFDPRVVPYSKGWHIAKLVFRVIDVIFSIVTLSLILAFLFTAFGGVYFLIMGIPGVSLALIWEVAELITICARGGKRGMHPGAHVAVHLIIWLIFTVALGIGATIVAYAYDDLYYYYDYSDFATSNYIDEDKIQYARSMANAIVAFFALLLVVHFILFVRACRETHIRNRSNRPIYVVQGGPGGPVYLLGVKDSQMVQMQHPQGQPAYPQNAYPMPQRQSTYGAGAPIGPLPQQMHPQQMHPQQMHPQQMYPQQIPHNGEKRASTWGSAGNGQNNGYGQPPAGSQAQAPVEDNRQSMPARDGSFYGPGNGYNNA